MDQSQDHPNEEKHRLLKKLVSAYFIHSAANESASSACLTDLELARAAVWLSNGAELEEKENHIFDCHRCYGKVLREVRWLQQVGEERIQAPAQIVERGVRKVLAALKQKEESQKEPFMQELKGRAQKAVADLVVGLQKGGPVLERAAKIFTPPPQPRADPYGAHFGYSLMMSRSSGDEQKKPESSGVVMDFPFEDLSGRLSIDSGDREQGNKVEVKISLKRKQKALDGVVVQLGEKTVITNTQGLSSFSGVVPGKYFVILKYGKGFKFTLQIEKSTKNKK